MPKRASVVNFFRVRRGNLKTMGPMLGAMLSPLAAMSDPER